MEGLSERGGYGVNEEWNESMGEMSTLRDKQHKDIREKQTDRPTGEPRSETFKAGIVLCFSSIYLHGKCMSAE